MKTTNQSELFLKAHQHNFPAWVQKPTWHGPAGSGSSSIQCHLTCGGDRSKSPPIHIFFFFFKHGKRPRGLQTTVQGPRLGKSIVNFRIIYVGWVGKCQRYHPTHKNTQKGYRKFHAGTEISIKGVKQPNSHLAWTYLSAVLLQWRTHGLHVITNPENKRLIPKTKKNKRELMKLWKRSFSYHVSCESRKFFLYGNQMQVVNMVVHDTCNCSRHNW